VAKKKEILGTEMVSGYTPIHPALDFWEEGKRGHNVDRAIVSIGQQVKYIYDDESVDFKDGELTIISNGDYFLYSKKQLAERNLYYSRELDLPLSRWQHDDAMNFCKERKEGAPACPDISELYQQIRGEFLYYMDFDHDVYYDLMACFVIYSYFYPLFNNAPILQLWGNLKTGKSKTISLLDAMAFNPINSANISEATVFRVIEGRRAVILLDESEDLMTSERGKAISNLLLAGYSVFGETFRQEKSHQDRYKTMSFRVFSPKVVANIEGVSMAALKSRIIRIVTTGALDKIKSSRSVNLSDPKWREIRNKLYRLVLMRFAVVRDTKQRLPDSGLSGRDLSIWEGIFTIACLSGVWKTILEYAIENTEAMRQEMREDDPNRIILSELLSYVTDKGDGFHSVGQLWNKLSAVTETETTSKHIMGVAMTRLGFIRSQKKVEHNVLRGYLLSEEQILERLKRYEQ